MWAPVARGYLQPPPPPNPIPQGEGESCFSLQPHRYPEAYGDTGLAVTFGTDRDRTPLDQQQMHVHQWPLLQAPPQRLAQGRARRLGEGGGVAAQR